MQAVDRRPRDRGQRHALIDVARLAVARAGSESHIGQWGLALQPENGAIDDQRVLVSKRSSELYGSVFALKIAAAADPSA